MVCQNVVKCVDRCGCETVDFNTCKPGILFMGQ